MMKHYMLDEKGEPMEVADLLRWGQWYDSDGPHRRIVKQEHVGKLWVSTVFLGVDYRFSKVGPPILWETMVFDSDNRDVDCARCAGNREQAEAMHECMVKKYGTS